MPDNNILHNDNVKSVSINSNQNDLKPQAKQVSNIHKLIETICICASHKSYQNIESFSSRDIQTQVKCTVVCHPCYKTVSWDNMSVKSLLPLCHLTKSHLDITFNKIIESNIIKLM